LDNNSSGAYKKMQNTSSANHDTEPMLSPGTKAPDFTLGTSPDKEISLKDYVGKPVVLMFYPLDWSPTCTEQACSYSEHYCEFSKLGAQILGVSVDSVWSHQAFAKANKITFPLLADFEPKGATAKAYGVYRDKDGISERALFVIDDAGIIRWSYRSPIGYNPGYDGIVNALKSLGSK
jgi:peroxiredoxin